MRKLILLAVSGLLLSACTLVPTPPQTQTLDLPPVSPSPTPSLAVTNNPTENMPSPTQKNPAKSAVIKTNLGDITVQLYSDKAPITVANFAALAEGTVNWVDPKTGKEMVNTPLYQNVIFHRVIPDFMIQGGDPLGNGTGGPGYRFQDEFDSSLTFSEPYILAMANSGPSTNGSQFFITVVPTPWLNGRHTIFGKVTSGQDIVDKIVATPTGPGDKPLTDVVILSIAITR